jgi:hypothetical protein
MEEQRRQVAGSQIANLLGNVIDCTVGKKNYDT